MSKAPATSKERTSAAQQGGVAVQQNATKRHQAALLLAENELTDDAIAEAVGINRVTLYRWKSDTEFQALVGDYTGKIIASALRFPIAKKHKRIAVLNTLHDKALGVIEGRAARYAADVEDAESAINATRRIFGTDTPTEAATGLLVKQESVNATGWKTVNWAFDRALVAEIRDLHKQAAQELGQWDEKSTVDVNQTVTQIQIIGED